ncbi:MAG: peptidoglycan bridge formation glycyltransferase FemA/FemB family protein [bacterium]
MKKVISISMLPTFSKKDFFLVFKLFLSPWKWVYGNSDSRLKEEIGKVTRKEKVYLFENGRTAIYALLKGMGIGEGDEVAIQAFTCVAVVNPIRYLKATPVFIDIDENFNMDIKDLKRKVGSKIKAVIVQHTFGSSADLENIITFCRNRGIVLIEDLAHGLGGEYKGEPLGFFGDVCILSFGRDKVISGVSGGALATNDKKLSKRIEKIVRHMSKHNAGFVLSNLLYALSIWIILSTYNLFIGKALHFILVRRIKIFKAVSKEEKEGKIPERFYKGLPNALCEIAFTQLVNLNDFVLKRKNNAQYYAEKLHLKFDGNSSHLRFSILSKDPKGLLEKATMENIFLGDWYNKVVAPKEVDLERFSYKKGSCPKAEDYCQKIVNLPTNPNLNKIDLDRIVQIVAAFEGKALKVAEIRDKKVWDSFVTELPDYTFLQSWDWGEFNEKMRGKVWRLGVFEGKILSGVCQAVKIKSKRGTFLFIPHGPLFREFSNSSLSDFVPTLKKIAYLEDCSFIRISPWEEECPEKLEVYKSLNFRNAPTHMHAEDTWLLPIDRAEEEVFSLMRKTARNLIRRAQKEGVVIKTSRDIKDVSLLFDLQIETSYRHKFVPFSKKYLEREFEIFNKDDSCLLFIGKVKRKVYSVALIIFYGKFAYYFHSGSILSTIPISYLLQWEVIKMAKKRGCTVYNLWGVAPPEKRNHPWKGLTIFKSSFGGHYKKYMHAQDLIISPRYFFTWLIEKVPRNIRAGI